MPNRPLCLDPSHIDTPTTPVGDADICDLCGKERLSFKGEDPGLTDWGEPVEPDVDLPLAVELSRDVDRIVTATTIRIDCRRCGDWSSGTYKAAHLGHEEHMRHAHSQEPRRA